MAHYTISYLSYANSQKATEYSKYRATQGFYTRALSAIACFFACLFYISFLSMIFTYNEPAAFFVGILGISFATAMYLYAFHIRDEITKYRCESIILEESEDVSSLDREIYLKEKKREIKQSLIKRIVSILYYVYSIAIGLYLVSGVIAGIVRIVNGKTCVTLVYYIIGLIVGIITFFWARGEVDSFCRVSALNEVSDSLNNSEIVKSDEPKAMFYCRKCGASIPRDSLFCPECGERVFSHDSKPTNSKNDETTNQKTSFAYKLTTRILFYVSVFILVCFGAETLAPIGSDKSAFLLVSLLVAGVLIVLFRQLRKNSETRKTYTVVLFTALIVVISSIIVLCLYAAKKNVALMTEPDSKQILASVTFTASDVGNVDKEHFEPVSEVLINGEQVESGDLIAIDFSDKFDLEYKASLIYLDDQIDHRVSGAKKITDKISFDDIKNIYRFESTIVVNQIQTFTVKGRIEYCLGFWDIVFFRSK